MSWFSQSLSTKRIFATTEGLAILSQSKFYPNDINMSAINLLAITGCNIRCRQPTQKHLYEKWITKQFNTMYIKTLGNTRFTHLGLVFRHLMMLNSALSFSMQQTGGEGTDRNQPPVLAGVHTGRKRQQSVPAEGAWSVVQHGWAWHCWSWPWCRAKEGGGGQVQHELYTDLASWSAAGRNGDRL